MCCFFNLRTATWHLVHFSSQYSLEKATNFPPPSYGGNHVFMKGPIDCWWLSISRGRAPLTSSRFAIAIFALQSFFSIDSSWKTPRTTQAGVILSSFAYLSIHASCYNMWRPLWQCLTVSDGLCRFLLSASSIGWSLIAMCGTRWWHSRKRGR